MVMDGKGIISVCSPQTMWYVSNREAVSCCVLLCLEHNGASQVRNSFSVSTSSFEFLVSFPLSGSLSVITPRTMTLGFKTSRRTNKNRAQHTDHHDENTQTAQQACRRPARVLPDLASASFPLFNGRSPLSNLFFLVVRWRSILKSLMRFEPAWLAASSETQQRT
jgi:hypothetical protein